MTTEVLLVIALAAYVVAASWGGAYYLLLANLGFSLFVQGTADIAGLYVNPSDLMFLVLVSGCVTSPSFARSVRLRSAPHFRVWLLLGVILSITYVLTRQQLLSDPLRAIYQVYRYCWKPILYYPLAAALTLGSSRRKQGVATVITLLGACASLEAIQSAAGSVPTGLFNHKNIFGAALVAPSLLGLGLLVSQKTIFAAKWVAPALATIWAGLILSGSRGAFLAAAAASLLMLIAVYPYSQTRRIATRIAMFAGAGALAALVVFPQLLSSEGVEMLRELDQGAKVGNFQWRLTKPWPYFVSKIREHPWIGVGELAGYASDGVITPHNGYLSVAYTSGIPACVLFSALAILAALRARRTFRDRSLPGDERILALAFGCAVVGILTHNVVEVTMQGGLVGQLFWVAAGAAACRQETRSPLAVQSARPQRSIVQPTSAAITRRRHLVTPRPSVPS